MRIELKGLLAALAAGVFVVGASYGVSALMTSLNKGSAPVSASSPQMDANMKRMAANMGVTAAQLVSTGHGFYVESCASCHGARGQGGIGPRLSNTELSDAQIATTIKNGVKGKMPAYGNQYDATKVEALTAYIRSLKK